MKKATFPLRFGPSLERLRNPFERATFVITNFPLRCLLLSLLNLLLKEVLSFDEEDTEEENTSANRISLSLLLFYPTQTKMIPQENSFSLSLSQNTEEKRDHRETMCSTTTTTTAKKNSLSSLSSLSLSRLFFENNVMNARSR